MTRADRIDAVVQLTVDLTDFFAAHHVPVNISQQALLRVFLMTCVIEGRELKAVLELVEDFWPIVVDSYRMSKQ